MIQPGKKEIRRPPLSGRVFQIENLSLPLALNPKHRTSKLLKPKQLSLG